MNNSPERRRARRRPQGQGQSPASALREVRNNATRSADAPKSDRPGPIRRLVDHWWDRLIGAVYSGSLADQTAQYSAHHARRDYLFNSLGMGVWGALFPILTVIATHLAGAEQAGMFAMAFVIANLLQFIGNYGVRTFQVSDIDEMDSFGAYQVHRVIACALMVLVGYLYCMVRGYADEMLLICAGTFAFRAIDAVADVYEGRLQQLDKLYLSGVSQIVRCSTVLVVFTLALVISQSIPVASIAMAIVSLVSLVAVTIPLTLFETPRSRKWDVGEVIEIFQECFPAFVAQFLFALIEAIPKFVMEGSLSYDNQLYFNAIYFPAQGILITVSLAYKPQLVRLANIWSNPNHRKRFDLIVIAVLVGTALFTAGNLLVTAWIGIPLTSLIYGLDFEPYRQAQYLMIVAGGMSAAIDFLYQIITVLRQQEKATSAYGIAFAFVTLASFALINIMGFDGAVWAYFSVMVVLLALLVIQYVRARLHPKEY
jgi:O-antigen/teichoic acid export membrane protein